MGIASFVLINLLATKGNKRYRQPSKVRTHSVRQGVSPWAVKQKQQHHVLSHTYQLPPVSSHIPWISSCLSPLSPLGWACKEIPAARWGPSLRTASTSQWLSWLLTFVFGKEDENLPFYRRRSILKWSAILFYQHLISFFSAGVRPASFPFLWVSTNTPSPQSSLLPVSSSTTGSTNKNKNKTKQNNKASTQKAKSHQNKTSVQLRKAGFVTCTMRGKNK